MKTIVHIPPREGAAPKTRVTIIIESPQETMTVTVPCAIDVELSRDEPDVFAADLLDRVVQSRSDIGLSLNLRAVPAGPGSSLVTVQQEPSTSAPTTPGDIP